MVDGLYAGDSSLTVDFATVAYRIQLLGFNAIRLPFSFLVSNCRRQTSVWPATHATSLLMTITAEARKTDHRRLVGSFHFTHLCLEHGV